MRWTVLVAAATTACLFPDLSGLTDGAKDGSSDVAVADGSPDGAVPVAPTEVDLGLGYIQTFTVDATKIYFMSSSLGGFFSADKTNGGNRVMISGDVDYDLTLDANNYYWLTAASVVQLARTNGANGITDVTGNPVTAFAIDGSRVYASTGGATGSILSAPIGGGSPTTLTATAYPGSIAVDSTTVYFVAGGGVQTVPLGGGNASSLGTTTGNPDHLLVSGNTVFWVDYGSGTYPDFPSSRIESIDKSGAPLTQKDLTGPQFTITSVATDGANLYFGVDGPPSMDDAGNETHPNGEIHRVPIGGGPVAVLAMNQGSPQYVCFDDAYVYWVNQDEGTVWRTPK
jgi:hypothetical protein